MMVGILDRISSTKGNDSPTCVCNNINTGTQSPTNAHTHKNIHTDDNNKHEATLHVYTYTHMPNHSQQAHTDKQTHIDYNHINTKHTQTHHHQTHRHTNINKVALAGLCDLDECVAGHVLNTFVKL
jgi:hypothetical protein